MTENETSQRKIIEIITILTNIKMFNNSVSVFSVQCSMFSYFFGFTILPQALWSMFKFWKLNRFDPSTIYTAIAFVTSVPDLFLFQYIVFSSSVYFVSNPIFLSFLWLFASTLVYPDRRSLSVPHPIEKPLRQFATFININTLKIICISFFITNVFFFLIFFLLFFRLNFNADASSDSNETSR